VSTTARNLAYIYTALFAAVLGVQFVFAWFSHEIPETILRQLDISLGVLFGIVIATKGYFTSTSEGSARKTEIMTKPKE